MVGNSLVGICLTLPNLGFFWVFFTYPKISKHGNPLFFPVVKVLTNEDTLLRTHCCRHKCFPVCPRAQHLLRTQILCPGDKNVSDFVQKHFVSATNVSQFARARKLHEQQCFRNKVSWFVSSLRDFPQTKLYSEINAPPLLNEHGDPHFLFYKFNENNILNN